LAAVPQLVLHRIGLATIAVLMVFSAYDPADAHF
jgi:hypothetical protein